MINPSRRSLIIGLGASLVAAPAIVRASSLMTIKAPKPLRYMGTELVYDSVPGPVYYLGQNGFYVYGGDFGPLEISWSAENDFTAWSPSDASLPS